VTKDTKATTSSGNVFADLGFANPEEELLKAKLVREIRGIIKRRKLTQTKAADMLGLKQPDVSALVTGRVGKFRSSVWFDAWIDWTTRSTSWCVSNRAALLREQLRPRELDRFVANAPRNDACRSPQELRRPPAGELPEAA
jgi:predicted XRE-type DNA-binding protein